ncbi:MAG: hypothetical protein FNP40_14005 [Dehalobacter sp. 4CP]|uniref:helix-turn-helix domain-containing protein n=1 Tax=Dehalobacter sp. CP TaxID=2594474 RepID=UPI0013C980D8|nr:hypothetical protein [Dehalobacter sp. 4CP]
MAIGNNLKRILSENKMSIKELSIKSGIPLNSLYSITKRDSQNVSPNILTAISKTLGISIFDLTLDVDRMSEEVHTIECFNDFLASLGFLVKPIITASLSFNPEEAEILAKEAANNETLPYCEITKEGQEAIILTVKEFEDFQKSVQYAVQYELNKFKK